MQACTIVRYIMSARAPYSVPCLWQLWRHTRPLTFIGNAADHEAGALVFEMDADSLHRLPLHLLLFSYLFSIFHLFFCTCLFLTSFSKSSTSLPNSSWSVCVSFCPSGPAFNLSFPPFDLSSLAYLSLYVPSFPNFYSK